MAFWGFGRPQDPGVAGRQIIFKDVAARSNFSYVSNNNFTGHKYFPQPMCGGIAILDYDNDGRMDIFFTNGAKLPDLRKTDASFYNCLLRNKGDGTFEDVTAKAGVRGEQMDFSYGVAAGDYDNDGYPDLFICNTGKNTLYHNNGNGTFTDVTAQSGLSAKPPETLSVAAAWLDYDNDGLLDLVVSNYTFWRPEIDRHCEHDGMSLYCNPQNYPSVPMRLYHNLGHGKFQDVTERSGFGAAAGKGMGICVADFNGDGFMDVFVANDTERNFLFINQGHGTFKEQGLFYGVAYNEKGAAASSMGCDAKDYDNDGWVDIFSNNLMTERWVLFRNLKGRYFQDVSAVSKIAHLSENYSGWSNAFIDYNNDGWKDIYSANGDVENFGPNALEHDTMFENTGKDFVDVSQKLGEGFGHKGYHRGGVFADLNNDGFMDLVVTSLNQRPRILINSGGNGNHWLLVRCIGARSNRDAIGTKVKLTTALGRELYNHVTTSVGFMCSADPRLHFGLGGERRLKSIEVRWPSRLVQVLKDIDADRILTVREPQ